MTAISVNSNVYALQGLNNEIADNAAVFNCHARSVSVKNTGYFSIDAVLPAVIHHQAFRGSFPFVITAANSDRIDASPV